MASDQPGESGVAARLPNVPGSQRLTPPSSACAAGIAPKSESATQNAALEIVRLVKRRMVAPDAY